MSVSVGHLDKPRVIIAPYSLFLIPKLLDYYNFFAFQVMWEADDRLLSISILANLKLVMVHNMF